ncbi:peritrophin-48-like isoform X2 [Teleopsis dalmanni]|uniref:peritrophin-48-like isoform X1 n=1 Tax=Teleopsis dalmanni TaxID=139649 RepID=UPI0018CFC698|nr:peritrophin-48-like isoform X1 [Teleopsis dalmanni]XP_037931840.1 peritrophin-48-like isoform X2 [Teleopsis dalmanni]XP_037936125.1 peritrophin-48-like isoform X1 [Teleopsis dalmanni]XP_037936126.1 peritrophin-48-like isoform X2 [Teleopsis dalmanni]
MFGKQLLTCAIVLAIVYSINAEYNVDTYCTMVQNGQKLASVESCSKFYTCQNGVGTEGECGAGLSFDKNSQGCKASALVECYYDNDDPCNGKDKTYVPIVGTCDGWIYCTNDKELGRGHCGSGMIFKDKQCQYGSCNDNINEGVSAGMQSVCDIMQDNKFFGSTLDCQIWQKCVTGGLKTGTCGDGLIFNVQQQNCNYETGTDCSRVTGESVQPDEELDCLATQNGQKKGSVVKCSTFFICSNKKWVAYECDTNMFYDVNHATCLNRQSATPVSTCDRCEGSKKKFVNAVDPDCQKYTICKDSVRTGSGTCDDGYYFSEPSQACLADSKGLEAYASKNGACAVPAPTSAPTASPSTGTCKTDNNKCVCVDTTETDCQCGFDEDEECDVCAEGVEADGTCVVLPLDTCIVDGTKCICSDTEETDCQCGFDADDDCEECDDGVKDGKCIIPDVCIEDANDDCVCESGKAEGDGCTCGFDEGECISCPNGVTAGDCDA